MQLRARVRSISDMLSLETECNILLAKSPVNSISKLPSSCYEVEEDLLVGWGERDHGQKRRDSLETACTLLESFPNYDRSLLKKGMFNDNEPQLKKEYDEDPHSKKAPLDDNIPLRTEECKKGLFPKKKLLDDSITLPQEECYEGIIPNSQDEDKNESYRSDGSLDSFLDYDIAYNNQKEKKARQEKKKKKKLHPENHEESISSMRMSLDSFFDSINAIQPEVTFSVAEVRHYERILGDNPAVSGGASLAIGWNYYPEETTIYDLSDEENTIPRKRTCYQFIMSKADRKELLLELGYTEDEIDDSIRDINFVKEQRVQTLGQLTSTNMEEAIDDAKEKLFNVFFGERSYLSS